MFNFYREFTKDLQRRLNSRAFDIKPQTVVSNDVQLITDIERPYVKKITVGLKQTFNHDPVQQSDWQYGQTIVALDNTVITALTAGLPVSAPGIANPPLYIATNDDVYSVSIDEFHFNVILQNATANPTAVSHTIGIHLLHSGTTINTQDETFRMNVSGTIAAGASISVRNIFGPFNNNVLTSISNSPLPIRFCRERFIARTINPSLNDIDNQLTWLVRHNWSGVETQTLDFIVTVKIACTVEFLTPYQMVERATIATLQP